MNRESFEQVPALGFPAVVGCFDDGAFHRWRKGRLIKVWHSRYGRVSLTAFDGAPVHILKLVSLATQHGNIVGNCENAGEPSCIWRCRG